MLEMELATQRKSVPIGVEQPVEAVPMDMEFAALLLPHVVPVPQKIVPI